MEHERRQISSLRQLMLESIDLIARELGRDVPDPTFVFTHAQDLFLWAAEARGVFANMPIE